MDSDIDVRRITWKRVMDMIDRALRDLVVSLGGTANGVPRQDSFDIVVGYSRGGKPAILHGGPFANIAHGCKQAP